MLKQILVVTSFIVFQFKYCMMCDCHPKKDKVIKNAHGYKISCYS